MIDGALRIVKFRIKKLFLLLLAGAKRAFDRQRIPSVASAVHSRTGHWDSIYFTSLNTLSWGGRNFFRNAKNLLGFTTDSLVTSQLSLWGCHVIQFPRWEISMNLVEMNRSPKGILERDLVSQRSNELKILAEAHENFVGSIFTKKFGIICTRSGSLRLETFLPHVTFLNGCEWHEFHPHCEKWS
jgi:hypothetical protein